MLTRGIAMKRAFTCLLFLLALGACGGGGTANNTTNNGGPAPANDKPAPVNSGDTGDDGKVESPKEDPDKYKKVSGKMPEGWHALKPHVEKELKSHIKPLPAGWKFTNGVVNSEAPGASERAEKWSDWAKHAAGAMLYFVGDKLMTPRAAVEAHASSLAAGEPDIKEGGGIAWTLMQGGEVMVLGMSNKYGTYVAVGIVLTTDPEPAREAIRKWAESVKPE
jgi:hypothetical protein